MSHYQPSPNKPVIIAVTAVALLIAISMTAVLVVPSLQPRLVASSPGRGSPMTGSQSTSVRAVVIVMPSGVGIDQKLNFQPVTITVVVGVNNTIIWRNADSVPHTATSIQGDPAKFDTGNMDGGVSSNPVTLTVPGTYHYICIYHPGWMKGTIIVKPA